MCFIFAVQGSFEVSWKDLWCSMERQARTSKVSKRNVEYVLQAACHSLQKTLETLFSCWEVGPGDHLFTETLSPE